MDITIAGTPVVPGLDPEQYARINIELAAFDGEVGFGQFPVPDQAGSGVVATGRQLMVEQGSALLSDGFIIDLDWQRGPFRVGAEREYNYSVEDANALLGGFRVSRSRVAETDYARVMAFAALDGPAWDTTWVLNSSTITLPKKKYDGDEGWAELITDVVEATGKTLFLHDKAAGGRCLHYHLLTTGHTSGLTITDDPSDVDATHWAPITPLRQTTAIDLRNDIKGRDQSGRVSTASDSASITAHDADGRQHQALVDFDANSQSLLDAKTAAYVASQKDDRNTYTCAIGPLDETALALIRVGDIIPVTSGAMGLSASNQRIAHMALSVWNGRPELWVARLELGAPVRRRARVKVRSALPVTAPFVITPYTCDTCTNLTEDDASDGVAGASWHHTPPYFGRTSTVADVGGDPDGAASGEVSSGPAFVRFAVGYSPAIGTGFESVFSHSGGVFHVTEKNATRDYVAFAVGPAAVAVHFVGDLYIDTFWAGFRQTEGRALLPPTPFELVAVAYDTAALSALDGGGQAAFDLDAYPQTVVAAGTHSGVYGTPYHIDRAVNIDMSGLTYLGFFLRNLAAQTVGVTNDTTPSTDNIAILFDRYPNYPARLVSTGGHTLVIPTYTIDFCSCLAFEGTPVAGQEVFESPIVGDGVTTTFVTAYPYVPGSLRVLVNGLDWTNIPNIVIETDPATGIYTIAYPFPAGSTVSIRYRAA